MDSDTVEESDMSLISRSFLHIVNDRVRKIQDQSSKDATQDRNKHSLIWRMFKSSTLEVSVFMGKNYLEISHSIKNTGKDLIVKQMFDIFEKFDSRTIRWDLWSEYKQLGWFCMETFISGDEVVVSFSHAKIYVFSDSVLCFGKMSENPISNIVWEDSLTWFKSSSQSRILDTIDGEPMKFEWNIFPGFTTLQLCNKVQEFMSKMSDSSEFKGRIISMLMFNDISWRSEDNEQECNANANLGSIYARRFSPGRWSFLGLGTEKKW